MQLTSTDTDVLTYSYNGINSTSQITVKVVPAYSCGSGYGWGNSQQWSVNGTIGTSTHFYVTTIFVTYHTMLLISHTFYIVLYINNRRGGIVVERSYRGSISVWERLRSLKQVVTATLPNALGKRWECHGSSELTIKKGLSVSQ